MASVVDICNKALSLIGQNTIVSLSENTPEALACRIHWAPLIDEFFRGHPWNCGITRKALSRLSDAPPNEFKYYYQLPADYLMVVEIFPDQSYSVEGRRILVDSPDLVLRYVKKLDDSTQYDSQLSAALSYLLAAELAYINTASVSMAETLRAVGKDKLQDAKATDSFEGKKRDPRGNKLLRAKYG